MAIFFQIKNGFNSFTMRLLFIICIGFNAVLGNTTLSFLEPETVEFVSYSDPISPREIRSSCQAYIEEYAKKAAQFTECSILNARPLRFCEKCITDFVTADSVYEHVMHVSV